MNRRTFLKKTFGSLLAFAGASGGTYYYARDIEPAMLAIRRETISSGRLPAQFDNYRIVQFSDTHIGFQYTVKQLRQLAIEVNELQPDLIVFTGDLVDRPDLYNWNDQLIDALRTFDAKDKLWIYGNHDHGGNGTTILKNLMNKAGFTLLLNEHQIINRGNAAITIAGIDDMSLGRPDIDAALHNAPSEHFTILLSHAPDFADIARSYPVDLQLSGHSHGGQIRLPFLGSLYTPSYATKYIRGKYDFNDRSRNLDLYVNSGIGTTRLPYRFLCKPEVHCYTLSNKV
ncbi:metallophosphoesterase [Aciduricibacillus chroicocephali]|uniref:Metallophosphoesterase n=1 Tax=Aciduricibacillus chroicocephali TaxID=3054939 RepID=A0ABY9L1F1_9BACI|nr:metallophosphoesterase [Bacillaceae bacterium 44XB]